MIKLNKTLGEDYKNDLDDVYRTKSALNRIGHYDIPDYGLTKYPDKQLFDGIRSFQRKEKLSIDGVMKPDGETAISLNKRLYNDNPDVKSPTFWCACGAPHGGAFGDKCYYCHLKA